MAAMNDADGDGPAGGGGIYYLLPPIHLRRTLMWVTRVFHVILPQTNPNWKQTKKMGQSKEWWYEDERNR